VDISGAITAEYGVFVDSAGNTLAIGDLAITINGATPAGAVSEIGDSWYALDITAEVTNAYFLPVSEANTLVFSTATADKSALITTHIERRTVIQSIARV